MPRRDYIPQNWESFAIWMSNFAQKLPTVADKYGISEEKVAQTQKDYEWVNYWVNSRNASRQQKRQLDRYIENIANGVIKTVIPNDPVWELPSDKPETVPPGVKKRVREIANGIKQQKSIYSVADGRLLDIILPEEVNFTEETAAPELKLRSLANFNIETDFFKFNMNAVRIEARHKGENWQLAAYLNKSPGTFSIVPLTPDSAEQIEIRAVYIKGNEPFGNYSPIYSVVIVP